MRSRTYIAVPPGATIKEQLEERRMSQKEFALRMGLSEKHVSRLINGDVQLTAETALKLESVLGTPAEFWNRLEALYREKIIKAQEENTMDEDEEILKHCPYDELAKLGWIEETENPKERVFLLRKYFSVSKLSLLNNPMLMHALLNDSESDENNMTLRCWIEQAIIQAREIQSGQSDLKDANELISSFSEGDSYSTFITMQNDLLRCGIIVLKLPKLKGLTKDIVCIYEAGRFIIAVNEEMNDDQKCGKLIAELNDVINAFSSGNDAKRTYNSSIWNHSDNRTRLEDRP